MRPILLLSLLIEAALAIPAPHIEPQSINTTNTLTSSSTTFLTTSPCSGCFTGGACGCCLVCCNYSGDYPGKDCTKACAPHCDKNKKDGSSSSKLVIKGDGDVVVNTFVTTIRGAESEKESSALSAQEFEL